MRARAYSHECAECYRSGWDVAMRHAGDLANTNNLNSFTPFDGSDATSTLGSYPG